MAYRAPGRLGFTVGVISAVLLQSALVAQAPSVKGTYVVGGKDALLTNVRASRTTLDDGKKKMPGYVVLLSAKPATGDLLDWRTAEPSKRGSFIVLLLESNGNVWAADLGHMDAKHSPVGVITEVQKAAFEVKGDRISGRYHTLREEEFFEDHYTIDVTFDVPLAP
jgi:hypothetical protein